MHVQCVVLQLGKSCLQDHLALLSRACGVEDKYLGNI